MKPPTFLRLGAGKARRYPLSAPATLLDRAAQAGLPTPPGIILLDEGWQQLLAEGVIRLDGQDVHVDGADILLRRFALHASPRPVAVRPLFAGGSATHLNVAPDDTQALIHALIDVWQTSPSQPNPPRRDLLVMNMVAAQHAGLALLRAGQAEDPIYLTDGPGGSVLGTAQALPRLKAWQRPTAPSPHLRRLQQLLRGVRRSLTPGAPGWAVAWLDDGATCWLWGLDSADTPLAQAPTPWNGQDVRASE